jgi:fatty-acyl-CoA synthase/long-chain acyl-CoA synthetase
MDSRGYLTLTGRLKELIIRGGENIAPAEIESHLISHDDVVDCAVVGLPHDRLGEEVAAVLRISCDADALVKEFFVEYLRDRLAPFKIPTRWFVVAELPVTPTGKVRKFQLRDAIIRGEVREL